MVNLGYIIARQLRKNNLDVDLLMEKNPPKTSDPLKFDPELKNELIERMSKLGYTHKFS